MIGAMHRDSPAQFSGGVRDPLAMSREALPVIIAHAFYPAEHGKVASFGAFEASAAAIGKILFRRIDNPHQMAYRAGAREALHTLYDARTQKIAQPYQAG